MKRYVMFFVGLGLYVFLVAYSSPGGRFYEEDVVDNTDKIAEHPFEEEPASDLVQEEESYETEPAEEPVYEEELSTVEDIDIHDAVMQLLESRDFIPFDPSAVEISEYGRQVAIDFLRQMDTIFVGMWEAETTRDEEQTETGRFLPDWGWVNRGERRATYEVPEFYYVIENWGIRGVYNREGERLTYAPWAFSFGYYGEGVSNYASGFQLFDFNNSGIPDIFVHYSPITTETGIPRRAILYRYIDGEYRMVGTRYGETGIDWFIARPLSWGIWKGSLFVDDSGRIIVLEDDEKDFVFDYHHVVITDEGATAQPLMLWGSGWEFDYFAWRNHHWSETIQMWGVTHKPGWWYYDDPTIFGTNIPLTPLQSLTDLETEIFTLLQQERQNQ